MHSLAPSSLALLALLVPPATAQIQALPRASQHAETRQTVGITELSVDYHRPGVKGRAIFGELVPYGLVWRAGANENTVFSVSDPVRVEGEDLPAGTYGLHMIPSQGAWTIAFSHDSSSWGSYAYDPALDALRVQVQPVPAEHVEWLRYDFSPESASSASLTLRWAELAVPLEIQVDTPELVFARLEEELAGEAGKTWSGWHAAASYCISEAVHLEQASAWIDQSLALSENFQNLSAKADLLHAAGQVDDARRLRLRAMELGTAQQLANRGFQLLSADDAEGALELFQIAAERDPGVWFVWNGMGQAYQALDEVGGAIECFVKAAEMAPSDLQRGQIERMIGALEAQ